jgi:hypothetical protein
MEGDTIQTTPPQAVVTPIPDNAMRQAVVAARAPANVPDKFKNQDGTVNLEALAAGYRELEAGNTQAKQAAAVAAQIAQETAKPEATEEKPATGGLDLDSLLTKAQAPNLWQVAQAEIQADGKVSDATKKALVTTHGVDETVIAGMEMGHKAQAQVQTAKLAAAVGGVENLKTVLSRAAAKLDERQLGELKTALKGPMAGLVLRGLAAQLGMVAEAPKATTPAATEPRSILDGFVSGGGVKGIQPYKSAGEMIADIRNPKYAVDPEFRDQVAARIAAAQNPR